MYCAIHMSLLIRLCEYFPFYLRHTLLKLALGEARLTVTGVVTLP